LAVSGTSSPTGEPADQAPDREPDVRFALANERTYLAWLRTSLGLIASGIAVERLLPAFGFPGARQITGIALVAVGVFSAATSHLRWRRIDAALRSGSPVPPPTFAGVIAAVIAIAGAVIIVLLIWKP
jgi:putative membrane protein